MPSRRGPSLLAHAVVRRSGMALAAAGCLSAGASIQPSLVTFPWGKRRSACRIRRTSL